MTYQAKLADHRERIVALYRAGWSLRAIGSELGVTREAVRLRLAQWGIERRARWEHPTRRRHEEHAHAAR